jgi:predicted Zn-dependent peptidase
LSEIQSYSERVAAVILDQVNAVARKYACPDQAFLFLVGDRKRIAPQLRDFCRPQEAPA